LTFGSPTPGEILAERYQIGEHIGNDSLGRQLHLGLDVILRRPVAIVLRYPGGESAGEMLAGAVAASRIVHPHLVGVYDAIDEGDRAYVVREWVDGIALRDLVAEEPLDAGRAVVIAWAVTDAVAALHATGMAHGNIHPGTVLVGHDGRVVLTDARADVAATPEADIRAIGATLYCALTGYWPHAEAGPTKVPDGVRDSAGQLAAPRQVRAGIPAHLDSLTSSLLNPNLPLPAADVLVTELARFSQVDEGSLYDRPSSALNLDAFDTAADAPQEAVRPAARKLAVGVVGLLVLALAGTLAAARVLGGGDDDGTGTTPPGGASSVQAKPPTGQPQVFSVPANQVRVIDPKGNRQREFRDAANVVDGNPATTWRTDSYYGRPDFGGLKQGMGIWLDLGSPQQVASVQVQLSRAGASGELRAGSTDPGSSSNGDAVVVAEYQKVGEAKTEMQTNVLFPGSDQKVRYLLVWLTKLPSSGADKYGIEIKEITVLVQP
jgi:hypothetical protein